MFSAAPFWDSDGHRLTAPHNTLFSFCHFLTKPTACGLISKSLPLKCFLPNHCLIHNQCQQEALRTFYLQVRFKLNSFVLTPKSLSLCTFFFKLLWDCQRVRPAYKAGLYYIFALAKSKGMSPRRQNETEGARNSEKDERVNQWDNSVAQQTALITQG